MVDEFQDTDPVQWKVIDRAFTDRSTLILIGDPKQAIYAFRGGDIVTYLKAAQTAGVQKTLGDELAQRRRPGAAPAGDPEAAPHSVIRGSSCTPSKRTTTGRACRAPRATTRSGCGSCAGTAFGRSGTSPILIGDLRSHIPADMAADIGDLLASGATFDGKPVGAGDVAVIVEKHKDARACFDALCEAGIPAVYTGDSDIFKSDAAEDWLCLLEAFDQPHRPGMVRAAAATMFFGKTAETLVDGRRRADRRRRGDVAGVGRPCPRARRRRHLRGRAAERHGRQGAVVAGRRTADDRPRAHDAAVAGGGAPRALQPARAARLAAGAARRGSGAAERFRRLDNDAAAVQVMTVFGGQGTAVSGRVSAVRVQPQCLGRRAGGVPRGRSAVPVHRREATARTSTPSRGGRGTRMPATTAG